jgi:hypothetical protein
MVNSFLVNFDFRKSSDCLDNLRLCKQRVEAYQILIALYQLRFLARHFGIPDYPVGQDTPKSQREAWINKVLNTFKGYGYVAILIRGDMLIHFHNGQTLPRKPDGSHKLLYDPTTDYVYEVKGKRQKVIASGPKDTFVLPGEELITTGFKKHPAFCMWLGFEDCLKQYINAHIDAWIARGKNNTMMKYEVSDNVPRPSWTLSPAIINNFKATLLDREIKRREPAWYLTQPDFVEAWAHSPQHAEQVNNFAKQLPSDQWYNYVDDKYLALFGNFSGFIWS